MKRTAAVALRAVLFDLDGTLADTERQYVAALERALGGRGRRLDEAERAYAIGHGWNEIYERLSKRGGIDLERDALIALSAAERARIVEAEGLAVLPGAIELVRRLGARWPIAVVSGSSRVEVALCLRALGLSEVFPWFVAAEDAPRGKPYPDGYLVACRRLGLAPRECLAIEDSTAGIRAAKAAGMACVAVRAGNFAGQAQEEADLIVDTLLDLDDELLVKVVKEAYNKR